MPHSELAESRALAGEGGQAAAADQVLLELERQRVRLLSELDAVDRRLFLFRTADPCPLCGGEGRRWIRGGLYGELQPRPCSCLPADPA